MTMAALAIEIAATAAAGGLREVLTFGCEAAS
jgi:hypothetical protein